jgi:hypothetical protein
MPVGRMIKDAAVALVDTRSSFSVWDGAKLAHVICVTASKRRRAARLSSPFGGSRKAAQGGVFTVP